MIVVNRCRNSYYVELTLAKLLGIRRKLYACLLDSVISDFSCGVDSFFIKFNLSRIKVISYNLDLLGISSIILRLTLQRYKEFSIPPNYYIEILQLAM